MTNEKLVPQIADSNGVLSAVNKKKKDSARATVFDAFSRAFARQNSQFESGNGCCLVVMGVSLVTGQILSLLLLY